MATGFPTGVASFGLPVLPSYMTGVDIFPGNNYFVGSSWANNSNTAGVGTLQAPYSTVAYALTQMTANNGDVLWVLPGHTETLATTAGGWAPKAGCSVVGIGYGTTRPTITWSTTTTSSIQVYTANVLFRNLYFNMTPANGATVGIDIQATGFKMDLCEVWCASTASLYCINPIEFSTNATDFAQITRCYIHGLGVAGTTQGIYILGNQNIGLYDSNVITGNFTTTKGGIYQVTGTATNLVITNNFIANNTASSTACVAVAAGTTGMHANGRYQMLSGTAPVVAAAMTNGGGNYYVPSIGIGTAAAF